MPAAFAACNTSYTNTTAPGCTNAATITGISINNSTITSDITNAGTISPNGISFINGSTLTGTLSSTGTLVGGISNGGYSSGLAQALVLGLGGAESAARGLRRLVATRARGHGREQ